ncbi:LacI family DNA-binding transcriptional regulator [Chitinophaga caseinilytica]|uniref:LacI family DNA-binding transcriptional regulator n=1 Tax=Chitinophaga caseinilytica TaxID=2267521 RepID=A0ABZ2YYU9_9BACT
MSTVSKALNNDATISSLTSERVKALARELNYIPNEAARHFKLNRTSTLGLIVPDILDQYYAFAANGVEAAAEERGYHVMLAQSREDEQKEERIIDLMIRNRVDGVVAAISKTRTDMVPYQKLLSIGIPVVCIGREPATPEFDFVSSNNMEGGRLATDFLIRQGHRHIAHLRGPEGMRTGNARYEGYKLALEQHGIPLREELVEVVDFSREHTEAALARMLALEVPPTAVFAFKNYMALDGIAFLKKYHPQLVDVMPFTGFGNLPILDYLDHKPAASIEESSHEMGLEAAMQLFSRIREGEGEEQSARSIQLPCKLVVHV